MQVSQVLHKHSICVTGEVQAGSFGRGRQVLIGLFFANGGENTYYRSADAKVQELRKELQRNKARGAVRICR